MRKSLLLFMFLLGSYCLFAQKENLPKTSAGFPINYEEDSVGAYVLPDLFTLSNGKKVTTAKAWTQSTQTRIDKTL